jgi:hypothetical protein
MPSLTRWSQKVVVAILARQLVLLLANPFAIPPSIAELDELCHRCPQLP